MNQRPVLFILNIFNEINYPGFRLNNERYSSHPEEREFLLPGGEMFEVEGFEKLEVKGMELHRDQPDLNGEDLTIIYLVRFG